MMRIGRAQMLVLVAGGCLLGSGAAAAGGPAIRCGATITKSTKLTADLLSCPATGLVIGADGITLDLGGHTISGTNADGGEGVANDGHAGVQIRNGKISGFRLNGVGLRGAQGNVVRGLVIRDIGAGGAEGEAVSAGILVKDSPGAKILSNDVSNGVEAYQSDGADVLGSKGSVVRGNTLSGNNWNGLALIESAGSRIADNELSDNGNNGTEVNGGSDSTWVVGNRADGNTSFGIVAGSATGLRITGNSATGNDTGLFFFDLHDSLINLNKAIGNNEGLDLMGGQFGSDGNRVIGNTASRNRSAGIGIASGADNNIVSGNVANENKGPVGEGGGIYVAASTGNQLFGNTANGNLDTGIGVFEDTAGDSAGNSLKANTTNRNKGHGIDAVTGSIDGGGNHAAGNWLQPQCVNVVCSA
jgi:parallel beta-helix repeat protein